MKIKPHGTGWRVDFPAHMGMKGHRCQSLEALQEFVEGMAKAVGEYEARSIGFATDMGRYLEEAGSIYRFHYLPYREAPTGEPTPSPLGCFFSRYCIPALGKQDVVDDDEEGASGYLPHHYLVHVGGTELVLRVNQIAIRTREEVVEKLCRSYPVLVYNQALGESVAEDIAITRESFHHVHKLLDVLDCLAPQHTELDLGGDDASDWGRKLTEHLSGIPAGHTLGELEGIIPAAMGLGYTFQRGTDYQSDGTTVYEAVLMVSTESWVPIGIDIRLHQDLNGWWADINPHLRFPTMQPWKPYQMKAPSQKGKAKCSARFTNPSEALRFTLARYEEALTALERWDRGPRTSWSEITKGIDEIRKKHGWVP